MEKYLYIESSEDGDTFVSLNPVDADDSEYKEINIETIEKSKNNCYYVGRGDNAKVKILIKNG